MLRMDPLGEGPPLANRAFDHGAQAGQFVGAGLAGLAHHIDLDAAQAAQVGIDVEVGKHLGQLAAQHAFQVFHGHAGQREGTDLGQADLAVAVQRMGAAVIHGAPDLDAHFVASAQQVFSGCGQGGVGGVALGAVKQFGTKHGQQAAGGFLHKALELAGLLGALCAGACGLGSGAICGVRSG